MRQQRRELAPTRRGHQSPEPAPNRFRHSATRRTPGEPAFGDPGAPPRTATRRRTAGPHVAGAADRPAVACQRLSGSFRPCRPAWSPTCLYLGGFAAPCLARRRAMRQLFESAGLSGPGCSGGVELGIHDYGAYGLWLIHGEAKSDNKI
jgi:hypothetical protein